MFENITVDDPDYILIVDWIYLKKQTNYGS